MAKKLSVKAQAAAEKILASGQTEIRYHGCGGAILADGTKIHSHIIKSLVDAGIVKTGSREFREYGSTAKPAPWTWLVIKNKETL